MFPSEELSEGLPQFETRQALIVLDLQNDFVSPQSQLPVSCPPDFLDNIKALVPAFRGTGDILWVRTEFEAERPISRDGDVDSVVVDDPTAGENRGTSSSASSPKGAKPSKRSSQTPEQVRELKRTRVGHTEKQRPESKKPVSQTADAENEAFLTRSPSSKFPVLCLAGSDGAQFAESLVPLIDDDKDSTFIKSHYSAFNSTFLLPHLRGTLVTELYVCGLISNISVFATTLDAARHGFSISLVEDCIGYRDKARHQKAMQKMTDYAGAEIINSAEVLEKIRAQDKGIPPPITADAAEKSVVEKSRGKIEPRDKTSSPASKGSAKKPPQMRLLSRGFSGKSEDSDTTSAGEALSADSDSPSREGKTSDAADSFTGSPGDGFTRSYNIRNLLQLARETTPARKPDIKAEVDAWLQTGEEDHEAAFGPEKTTSSTIESTPQTSDDIVDAVSTNLEDVPPLPVPKLAKSPALQPIQSPAPLETATQRVVRPIRQARIQRTHVRGPSIPTLGPNDTIGEGDCRLVPDLLTSPLKDGIFEEVRAEVQWKTMHHRGGEVPRLVAVQGAIEQDGSFPIYRHPADESPPLLPFSPSVLAIKKAVEATLDHPVNHVLIQYYRDGHDYISEHSDKTLDITRGSSIVNVSLGAQRTMTLRTKHSGKEEMPMRVQNPNKGSSPQRDTSTEARGSVDDEGDNGSTGRRAQRVPMPHNSMFVLGQCSNMRWLHGIRQDKRPEANKTEEEQAFGGERISLTFRYIGTFIDKHSKKIWGQGAKSKVQDSAHEVIKGDTVEAESMVRAFGAENRQSDFDWGAVYGQGFDTVHITPNSPKLFICGDPLADIRVKLHLAESGIDWEVGQIGQLASTLSTTTAGTRVRSHPVDRDRQAYRLIRFIDNDPDRTEIGGVLPIIMYIEFYHRNGGDLNANRTRPEVGDMFTRMGQSNDLLNAWRALAPILTRDMPPASTSSNADADSTTSLTKDDENQKAEATRLLVRELELWETIVSRHDFMSGNDYCMADAAVWPVLREIVLLSPFILTEERLPKLAAYYKRMDERDSVSKVLRE
ncbi:MAG: hypothetical protein M1837_000056 [Sclerophora amabilis]|nr:MAG: hypothetical protein M1837_000056 [Sclerophora amabilis]